MPTKTDLPKLREEWNEIASVDALWAISSRPDRKFNKWQLEEFFATGRDQVELVLNICEKVGRPPVRGSALDFGCGVGRLTRHLAETFASVSAVDISEEMIERARSLNSDLDNVQFTVNSRPDLSLLNQGTFDFACSIFVLQHMPAQSVAETYLAEVIRVLKTGGVAVVQLPRALHPLRWLLARRTPYVLLRRIGLKPKFLYGTLGLHPMHMLAISPARVRDVATAGGGTVVGVMEMDKYDNLYVIAKGR